MFCEVSGYIKRSQKYNLLVFFQVSWIIVYSAKMENIDPTL